VILYLLDLGMYTQAIIYFDKALAKSHYHIVRERIYSEFQTNILYSPSVIEPEYNLKYKSQSSNLRLYRTKSGALSSLADVMILRILFVKSGLATILIFGVLALTFNTYTQNVSAQPTQNINLTGAWKANDGGTYYIRNIGNDVWWLGTSGNDDGKTFSKRIHSSK
jgi:hypothetical protein